MQELNDDTLCVCGHTLDYHHRWWMPGGGAFADECEFYGFNEDGGMMPNPDKDSEFAWIDHCHRFEVAV